MISRIRKRMRRVDARDERGAVLIITVVAMVSILLIASYAIDSSIWYVHARHLQTQADAAAWAGAEDFQYPCTATQDALLTNRVLQYDGSTGLTTDAPVVNQQVPTSPTPSASGSGHNLVTEINQSNFYNQSIPGDSEANAGKPCEDGYVDVKATETNLPSFLSIFGPQYINKQARVSIEQQTTGVDVSAFVEPLGTPTTVTAQLVNEDSSGATTNLPGLVTLTQTTGNSNVFTGTATLPSNVPSALIGTEVTLGGQSFSTTYNKGTQPPYGISYARVWPALSNSATAAPQASDIWIVPTINSAGQSQNCASAGPSAAGSNFLDNSTATSVYLCANLTFNTLTGANQACANVPSITFNEGGNNNLQMTCPTGGPNGIWQSTAAVSLGANGGGTKFTLNGWTTAAGVVPTGGSGPNSGPCLASPASKNCTGTFPGTDEQEAWTGGYDESSVQTSNSGEVVGVSLSNSSGTVLTSESQVNAASQQVTVTVQVLGLQNETSISSEGPSELSFGTNQQNLGIGCIGQGNDNMVPEIADGCPGSYTVITGSESCSNSPQTYCAGPTSVGNKVPAGLAQGMNDRVYCAGVTTGTCDSTENPSGNKVGPCPGDYNYWDTSNALNDVLNQSPADPRLITLFLTGFGNTQNGNKYLPISGFAEFYVTGWAGDPCLSKANGGNGTSGATTTNGTTLDYTTDDEPPGNNPGFLMGHFVKYVSTVAGGSGSGTLCTQNTFGNCIPMATK